MRTTRYRIPNVHWVAGALLIGTLIAGWTIQPALGQARTPVVESPWIGYDTSVYPEGVQPWTSRAADFNSDGYPDLATASWGGTPFLSILLADKAGGYLPPVTYQIPLECLDIEVGDFDKDNDIDIVTCETGRFFEGSSVSLWKNDGSGVFTYFGSFDAGRTGPSGITAADFDRDGWLDVAVAHDAYIVSGNTIAVLFNTGGSGFSVGQVLTLAGGTRSIAAGDLDGDQYADLIVGHESNRWTYVHNNNGTMVEQQVFPGIPAGSIPELPTVHVADIDLDHDLDVFFSNRDSGGVNAGAIGLWRNHGDGTFDAPETLSFNWYTTGGVNIATGDVTGDDWPDVLVATESSDNWFLLPSDSQGDFLPAERFRAGQDPISMEIVDLDFDQDRDVVVVARGSLEACVYLNPGRGEFIQPDAIAMTDPDLAPAFPTNVQASDIDRDGDLDLVVGFRADFAGRHGINVRRNNGDGTFAPIESYPHSTYPLHIQLGDINNDRFPDLLYLDGDGSLVRRLNLGDGTFGSESTIGRYFQSESFKLHDLNGDGSLDVLVAAFDEIAAQLNNGSGGFGPTRSSPVDDIFFEIGAGDFDGDGFADALTDSGIQGYAAISFGNGDGTFGSPNTVPTGRDVKAFDHAYIDSGIALDFAAIYNLDGKGLSIRRGRGDGNFFANENFHGSIGFVDHTSSVDVVDMDGDGLLDAVTANFSPQDVSFWKGLGDGTFERLQRYGVAEQAVDLAVGDFDGDGVRDVAAVTQVNTGRWWYPGVIMLKGINNDNPRAHLVLRQSDLVRGQPTTFVVDDLVPAERAYLLYSLKGVGSGPCPPQLGGLCLDLRNPVKIFAKPRADANGEARVTVKVPTSISIGTRVYTQAAAVRGSDGSWSVKSNTVSAQVSR